MNLSDLVMQFMALGGVAALIAVLVNVGKSLGWVTDGIAGTVVTGLNLLGLIALFVLKVVGFEKFANLDATAATIAQLLTLVLQLFFQFTVSKIAYLSVRGVPIIGTSYPLKKGA